MMTPVVLDDDGARLRGVTQDNSEWSVSASDGFGGSHRIATSCDVINAQWTVPQLDHSIYILEITWVADDDRCDSVLVQVYDGGTTDNLIEEFEIDQTEEPEGQIWIGNRRFQHLSDDLEIRNGALTVLLVPQSFGVICADAIRVSCPGDHSNGVESAECN
jgi:hypothetical protein